MLELLTVARFSWSDLLIAQKKIFLRQIWLPLVVCIVATLWPLVTIEYGFRQFWQWTGSILLQAAGLLLYIWAMFWTAVCFVSRGRKAITASAFAVALDIGSDALSLVVQSFCTRFFPPSTLWLFTSPLVHALSYYAIIILTRRATIAPGEADARVTKSRWAALRSLLPRSLIF
jgi:hypothetical protein